MTNDDYNLQFSSTKQKLWQKFNNTDDDDD